MLTFCQAGLDKGQLVWKNARLNRSLRLMNCRSSFEQAGSSQHANKKYADDGKHR